jgi:hypothetical protein
MTIKRKQAGSGIYNLKLTLENLEKRHWLNR